MRHQSKDSLYYESLSLSAERQARRRCSLGRCVHGQQAQTTDRLITHHNVSANALLKTRRESEHLNSVSDSVKAATLMPSAVTLTSVPGANCN